MKKLILLIAAFVFIGDANAFSASPPVPLAGGTVPANSSWTLMPIRMGSGNNHTYRVTCDIENPNFSKQYPVVLNIPTSSSGAFRQLLLDQLIKKYEIEISVNSAGIKPLWFWNNDTTDAVYIKNCMEAYTTY